MKIYTAEELNQWLDNPMTKGLMELIQRHIDRSSKRANDIVREDFFKNEKSEEATKCYAAAFGAALVLRDLKNLVDEFKEIEKEEDEEERKKIPDAIEHFLNFINKKEEK